MIYVHFLNLFGYINTIVVKIKDMNLVVYVIRPCNPEWIFIIFITY